jgi:cell division cycle protein 20 (cofactor of APC complex)
LPTSSQVTSLVWSPHSKEILSTHGHSECSINIWSYPALTKAGQITQAHDERVLGSALSPDGCTVATAAADENLKVRLDRVHTNNQFWKIWEARSSAKVKAAAEDADRDSHGRTKSAVRVR